MAPTPGPVAIQEQRGATWVTVLTLTAGEHENLQWLPARRTAHQPARRVRRRHEPDLDDVLIRSLTVAHHARSARAAARSRCRSRSRRRRRPARQSATRRRSSTPATPARASTRRTCRAPSATCRRRACRARALHAAPLPPAVADQLAHAGSAGRAAAASRSPARRRPAGRRRSSLTAQLARRRGRRRRRRARAPAAGPAARAAGPGRRGSATVPGRQRQERRWRRSRARCVGSDGGVGALLPILLVVSALVGRRADVRGGGSGAADGERAHRHGRSRARSAPAGRSIPARSAPGCCRRR